MADRDDKRPASRADAVRGAAVQAFQATAGQAGITRERAQELADELAGAAGRVIGALEELRPATGDDIRSVRDELRALEGRVAALEQAAAAAPAVAKTKTPAPKKKAAAKKKAAVAPTRTPRSST
jgi:polyhydroxyalkanoate synthesis regulator phasin